MRVLGVGVWKVGFLGGWFFLNIAVYFLVIFWVLLEEYIKLIQYFLSGW